MIDGSVTALLAGKAVISEGEVCKFLHSRQAALFISEQQVEITINLSLQKPDVSVTRKGAQPVLPQPGSVITGKVSAGCLQSLCFGFKCSRLTTSAPMQVTRVSPRLANVEILCVGTKPVSTTFSGIIRFAF